MQQQRLFNSSDGSNKNQVEVYFDGLCQPCNPGGTTCFAFIAKNEEGNTIHSEYGLAKHNSTNNVAEYTGIIRALEWLIANNYQNESIIIKGDSQLVIQQIKASYDIGVSTTMLTDGLDFDVEHSQI